MPSLLTQSIGATGASIVNAPTVAQGARASQNSIIAGVQKSQVQRRANESATDAKAGKKRSVQDEARVEGVFGEESDNQGQQPDSQGTERKPGGFNRVA